MSALAKVEVRQAAGVLKQKNATDVLVHSFNV